MSGTKNSQLDPEAEPYQPTNMKTQEVILPKGFDPTVPPPVMFLPVQNMGMPQQQQRLHSEANSANNTMTPEVGRQPYTPHMRFVVNNPTGWPQNNSTSFRQPFYAVAPPHFGASHAPSNQNFATVSQPPVFNERRRDDQFNAGKRYSSQRHGQHNDRQFQSRTFNNSDRRSNRRYDVDNEYQQHNSQPTVSTAQPYQNMSINNCLGVSNEKSVSAIKDDKPVEREVPLQQQQNRKDESRDVNVDSFDLRRKRQDEVEARDRYNSSYSRHDDRSDTRRREFSGRDNYPDNRHRRSNYNDRNSDRYEARRHEQDFRRSAYDRSADRNWDKKSNFRERDTNKGISSFSEERQSALAAVANFVGLGQANNDSSTLAATADVRNVDKRQQAEAAAGGSKQRNNSTVKSAYERRERHNNVPVPNSRSNDTKSEGSRRVVDQQRYGRVEGNERKDVGNVRRGRDGREEVKTVGSLKYDKTTVPEERSSASDKNGRSGHHRGSGGRSGHSELRESRSSNDLRASGSSSSRDDSRKDTHDMKVVSKGKSEDCLQRIPGSEEDGRRVGRGRGVGGLRNQSDLGTSRAFKGAAASDSNSRSVPRKKVADDSNDATRKHQKQEAQTGSGVESRRFRQRDDQADQRRISGADQSRDDRNYRRGGNIREIPRNRSDVPPRFRNSGKTDEQNDNEDSVVVRDAVVTNDNVELQANEDVKYDVSSTAKDTSVHEEKMSSPKRLHPHLKNGSHFSKPPPVDAMQKELLTQQLEKGEYDCMVCYEKIKHDQWIWSCNNCYHVFHLKCIRKWAMTSTSVPEGGWRCPSCSNVSVDVPPNRYMCFCGKTEQPEWSRYTTPHCCSEMCGKQRPQVGCTHRCNIPCHPGPCPACLASVVRTCSCGNTTKTMKCNQGVEFSCEQKCEKTLLCGLHVCYRKCHSGPCDKCLHSVEQVCYCGKKTQRVPCSADVPKNFSCDSICDKPLACGHHKCTKTCHEGDCPSCLFTPENVKSCPCGKTPVGQDRTSCQDPIPTCGQVCGRVLLCGDAASDAHICEQMCHLGECPPCKKETKHRCRCEVKVLSIPCEKLIEALRQQEESFKENSGVSSNGVPPSSEWVSPYLRCDRRCGKRKTCGRHKCQDTCCVKEVHRCDQVCGRRLLCRLHNCEETCHAGHCPPCPHVSFEELRCECGYSVIYPPVPCNTRKPVCSQPCSRVHSCGHPVLHNCHSDPECPPCTAFVERSCHGQHETRSTVPCYQTKFSCGRPCGKLLVCGMHKCLEPCHEGPCPTECSQPCKVERSECGHPCAAPCHDKRECPSSPCKTKVVLKCACGNRSEQRKCEENVRVFHTLSAHLLAQEMDKLHAGEQIDLNELVRNRKAASESKVLECDQECALIQRNRNLAAALDIENADLSTKPTGFILYNDYIKQRAREQPLFVNGIYNKLVDLCKDVLQGTAKCKSYSFPSMNRDQRHIVYELIEAFNCDGQSFDQEPNRNVTATATKERCRIPAISVMQVVSGESGVTQRQLPPPVVQLPNLPDHRPPHTLLRSEQGSSASGAAIATPVASSSSSSSSDPEESVNNNSPSKSGVTPDTPTAATPLEDASSNKETAIDYFSQD